MHAAIRFWTRRLLPGLALVLLAGGVGAQQYPDPQYPDEGWEGPYTEPSIDARVWFDRGEEPLVSRGDRMRLYYRTSADAFVAVFNIDTNGTVRMLYPRSPEDDHWVRGGRDYRLLFPRSPYWYVDDQPGMGYFFVVASQEPFDLSGFEYSYYDSGWDLSRVGRHVYTDPYVAMDDYVAALIPDWQYVPYALDFATYHVGEERYDYPRFLCYDCHGFRSYTAWNPYHYNCASFRVVIYDDPWYYPSSRYGGSRVVYAGIPRARLPRFEFKERADGEAGRPLVVTRATSGTRPGVAGDPAPRRIPSGIGSGGERGRAVTPGGRPGAGGDVGRRPGIPSDVGIPRRGGGAAAAPTVRGREEAGSVGRSLIRGREGAGAAGGPTVRGREGAGATGTPTTRGREQGSAGEAGPGGRRYVPVVRPPTRPSERSRPVLERRPPSRRGGGESGAGPARRPTVVLPPSSGSRGSGGGAVRRGGSGGDPSARPGRPSTPVRPSVRSGGTPTRGNPPARVTPRRGGGGDASTGRARSRGGGGRAGPPARPSTRAGSRNGGGGAGARPSGRVAPRSGGARPSGRVIPRSGGGRSGSVGARSRSGGSSPARPPARVRTRGTGSSGGGPARPPARARPPSRSSGGGEAGSRPDVRSRRPTGSAPPSRSRPPVRVERRGGGGGGAGG